MHPLRRDPKKKEALKKLISDAKAKGISPNELWKLQKKQEQKINEDDMSDNLFKLYMKQAKQRHITEATVALTAEIGPGKKISGTLNSRPFTFNLGNPDPNNKVQSFIDQLIQSEIANQGMNLSEFEPQDLSKLDVNILGTSKKELNPELRKESEKEKPNLAAVNTYSNNNRMVN